MTVQKPEEGRKHLYFLIIYHLLFVSLIVLLATFLVHEREKSNRQSC